MKNLTFLKLSGEEARIHVSEIAELRLKVFWDYPYLYEGSLEYERKYLETYFQASHSFILIVKDQDRVVGATTGIWAKEEEESFRKPFLLHGIDPQGVFYFGESVLLKEYRGQGIGKIFFQERESFARALGFIEYLAFCAVERESEHPAKPEDYKPLGEFWASQGFEKVPGLITQYQWPDRGELESTEKLMQYWIKKI